MSDKNKEVASDCNLFVFVGKESGWASVKPSRRYIMRGDGNGVVVGPDGGELPLTAPGFEKK